MDINECGAPILCECEECGEKYFDNEKHTCGGNYIRSLHEAWAREQFARVGTSAAWKDPAVRRIVNAWLVRHEPEHGWGTFEDALTDFIRFQDPAFGQA